MGQKWYKNVILNEITFFSYSKNCDLVIVYITYKCDYELIFLKLWFGCSLYYFGEEDFLVERFDFVERLELLGFFDERLDDDDDLDDGTGSCRREADSICW